LSPALNPGFQVFDCAHVPCQAIITRMKKEDKKKTVTCGFCGKEKRTGEVVPASMVQGPLLEFARQKHPDWSPEGFVCLVDLNRLRAEYVRDILEGERGRLTDLEEEVLRKLEEQELITRNVNEEYQENLTIGQRMADRIASFGGSWAFITSFFGVLLAWIVVNSLVLLWRPFDPYPFILLNLILSCLAAIQAPIIMMSQNRQEARDRLRSQHDYQINLKAELEIRHLHEKVEHLLTYQWQRLLEIQEMQVDMMEEIARGFRGR
jgi:uncharacterized membrane protein